MSTTHDPEPEAESKLLGAGLLKLRLAWGSLLFLIVGALLAPTSPTTLATPAESPTPLLEQQVQQTQVRAVPFSGVSEVAMLVREHGVMIPSPPPLSLPVWSDYLEAPPPAPRAGFGVFLENALVLTHRAALGGRLTVNLQTPDNRQLAATVVAYDPPTELVLLRVPPNSGLPAPLSTVFADPGGIGAGVGFDGHDIVVPVFFASRSGERYAVSEGSGLAQPGLPLFNTRGELLAISTGSVPMHEAIAVGAATARLQAQASGPGLRASLGIALQEIPAAVRPRLGDKGLLVARVVPGGPADVAGVEVGQLLRAVDGTEVTGADGVVAANASLQNGVPVTLNLQGTRPVTATLTPRSLYEVAALNSLAPSAPDGALPVREILEATAMEAAGIPGDALLMRVNGRVVRSRVEALQELRRRPGPVLLHLAHDGTWFFAAIEGAR